MLYEVITILVGGEVNGGWTTIEIDTGKSTVTALVGEMASASGRPTFVGGNLGTPLTDVVASDANGPTGLVVVEQIIRPTGLCDPKVEIRPAAGQVDDLLGEIRARAELGERVDPERNADDRRVLDRREVVGDVRILAAQDFGGLVGGNREHDAVVGDHDGARAGRRQVGERHRAGAARVAHHGGGA